ncbi:MULTISPECIES: cell division protein FtsB [Vibrio]|uniref:cell division protein FtsB n=1 Tax=Vibrio TaxID=662 RepID=UPI000C16E442|nr:MULTISPECIES: cell division protein FtsB [Vibrio]NAW69958.1 cell division protein FtsB [Vibrio sp. V28_P6S34P95]NAX05368.1 cell division protein FtsB [Vibrio sp. V30_P3S12P165]NAX33856.1 cell division protein FtsB [Vibrio sp. V29_P1S30P107]NAX37031.1 cell division protein FtsB [Vibrio sp. V27_P1S3P104]NAX39740.1 cell division protein FtsB [Vibrio sp. V26_P1S5P106]
MRVFAITLLLLFGWLQYHLWWGKNGIVDYRLVASEIAVQEQVNHNLQLRNQEMFAEIDDLRQGLDAIEERARHELGMVKEGETFFRVVGEEARP